MFFFKKDKFALGTGALVFIILVIVNTVNKVSLPATAIRSTVGFIVGYLCAYIIAAVLSRSVLELLAEHQHKRQEEILKKTPTAEETPPTTPDKAP